jgi:hypothetical protein
MLKKGPNFFQLVSNLFCVLKRGFVEPCKMFLCSKLPCLGRRSADFLQVFFAKNVCWANANILILVLRFLWSTLSPSPSLSLTHSFSLSPRRQFFVHTNSSKLLNFTQNKKIRDLTTKLKLWSKRGQNVSYATPSARRGIIFSRFPSILQPRT